MTKKVTRDESATRTGPRAAAAAGRKPLDEEIDIYGLTHKGKVRPSNQDHFLICSLRKHMDVLQTSLPDISALTGGNERISVLAMVADGVGSTALGEEAARRAVADVSAYVAYSMNCYYTADPKGESSFAQSLERAAWLCHEELAKASSADGRKAMATTLTLLLGIWPRIYLLQVGDSRYYLLRSGKLTQISRDQTMAQDLADAGIIARKDIPNSQWANVLSSAIGGPQTAPVVTAIDNTWDSTHLLCSDGLTKHVPDDQIQERLRSMTSSKQVCEQLLQDALDQGGTDNITIVVGRANQKTKP